MVEFGLFQVYEQIPEFERNVYRDLSYTYISLDGSFSRVLASMVSGRIDRCPSKRSSSRIQEEAKKYYTKVMRATAEVESDEDAVTGATAETQSVCFPEILDAADAGQSKAAVRMTRRGNQLVRRLEVGQWATLRVPNVDRGPTDPKNLLVVVMKGEDGLYTVGCREGVLGSKYTAADLSPIDHILIKADDVPDIRLTLRTATAKATEGQGFNIMNAKSAFLQGLQSVFCSSTDIDECAEGKDNCDPNATCRNSIGS
ncbi:uncharacterized protein [Palaemon carinicauda]|uniref:uncharacterized protein n=1 Tax=Palaemon carinicauda TaxID=392227 RepID=UPI0035B5DCE8